MTEAWQRLKAWGVGLVERGKLTALTELDPRNPDKRRFLAAWGLLVCGGLFVVIGLAFLSMYH